MPRPTAFKPWLATLLLLAVVVAVGLFFLQEEDTGRDVLHNLLEKEGLVAGMRLELYKAAEAEKSAVLSPSDQEAQALIQVSRHHSARVQEGRARLERLLAAIPRPEERRLLTEFDKTWAEMLHLDQELWELAASNTNLRAQALANTRAAQALQRLESALPVPAGPQAAAAGALGREVLIAALRVQALHYPHIAAAEDAQMDAIEADMRSLRESAQQGLKQLEGLGLDIGPARAAWEDFLEVNSEILRLSRLNNGIRSLELSLGAKRRATALAEDNLSALQEAIGSHSFKATR